MLKILPLFIGMILLAFSGCSASSNGAPSQTPGSSSPSQNQQETPAPGTTSQLSPPPATESPAAIELPLPLPTSKMFDLEEIDAVLYDAAVEFYSTKAEDPDLNMHLLMPSLGLLDSYQTEDGSTCYICWFRECDYYNLGYGLSDLENPQYTYGGGYSPARFTVSKADNGELVCTEIFKSLDGEGWADSVRTICGPKEELANAIIKDETLPVETRNITPYDPTELLNIYLDYYFR